MTHIDFCYWNFEHGGLRAADSHGDGCYNFTPLCRVIGHENRWPDVLIIGEADRYDYDGGAGLWGAAAAMREAGGRVYTPLMCSLPRDWGDFAPAIFVDTQTVQIHRFYHHRLPDFAARTRNVVEARIPGREDIFRIITGHGEYTGGEQRLADAKTYHKFAHTSVPCIIGMDWNAVLSGPQWEPHDLNDTNKWPDPWMLANRIHWRHGPAQSGPYRADTRSLDYLCGYWHKLPFWRRFLTRKDRSGWPRGHRAGGVGFHWVGELARDTSPTNLPARNGRQRLQIDGFVVNGAWRDRIVPGSFCVQDQLDPEHPDSDHLAVRVAIDV